MSRLSLSSLVTFFFFFSSLCLPFERIHAQESRPIGLNLNGVVDYSPELVFVDAFKMAREWIPFEPGSSVWDSGVDIPLGTNGYPLEIPYDNGIDPPQAVRALLYFSEETYFPSGSYHLIVSGTGHINLWGAASGSFDCPVDTYVEVDNNAGIGISIDITESQASDPIHDIRFIMPGFDDTYEAEPFNPAFLSLLGDFETLRFMDWMMTNNSPLISWEDRNTPDYYTQTLSTGVSYEYIVQLCNLLHKNAWICVPHQADDNFITEMARFFRDNLDPDLKIYVEYSNEVWNGIFDQSIYAGDMGAVLGYSGQPWEQGWQYYAKRTADVHHIFETEFEDDSRLVKVVASQAAVSWISNYILEKYEDPFYNPSGVQADALAIAPYFGAGLADNIGDEGLSATITVDEILDSLEQSLNESFLWMDEQKAVADEHNVELIAYEGGQHLVSYFYTDEDFTQKLTDANRNERMEDLYCQYFDYWYNSGDANPRGLFCHFSSVSEYSQYGSWGLMEVMGDTLSPKYLGLKNCVFPYNVVFTEEPDAAAESGILIWPNPSSDGIFHIQHGLHEPRIRLFDLLGRPIDFQLLSQNEGRSSLQVKQSSPGLFFIELNGKLCKVFSTAQ